MRLRAGLRNRVDEFSFNYVKDLKRFEGQWLLEENLINKAQEKAQEIRGRGMTTQELWEVAYWKGEMGSKIVLDNPESHTKCITKQAFDTQDDWEKIVLLSELKGIRESKGSAVLHFYDTEDYPIIDRHALWSVGLKREFVCNETLWREYVLFCREEAKEYNVDMRKLDRALWRFSYEMEKNEKRGGVKP